VQAGRRVALDVGTVRVGVAASDFHSILASGLATVARRETVEETADAILAEVTEVEPVIIYVGLPIALSGRETASTEDAKQVAQALQSRTSIPVRMIDERLTTVSAASALRSSNKSSKAGRQIIDQIAATVILEQAMASEKKLESWAGVSIDEI
jgi:putative holliday junction resolvase